MAAIAIAHGVAEHGGRYAAFAERLARLSIAVHVMDLRGHGRSGGVRVHVDRWSRYVEDMRSFLELVGTQRGDCPLFLLGHSLGALIALDLAIDVARRPLGVGGPQGVISGAAAIDPGGVAKPHLVAIARLLSRVTPRVSLDLGIEPAALSRDPAVVHAYRDDPLVERRATVRWGTEVLKAAESIRRRAEEIRLPTLVYHGEADRLTSPDGSRQLASSLTGSDVQLKTYPDVYHEPHNDLCADEVARDVAEWVTTRRVV
jgi:alpha-beta hydrolase superfamily lysophospholipase